MRWERIILWSKHANKTYLTWSLFYIIYIWVYIYSTLMHARDWIQKCYKNLNITASHQTTNSATWLFSVLHVRTHITCTPQFVRLSTPSPLFTSLLWSVDKSTWENTAPLSTTGLFLLMNQCKPPTRSQFGMQEVFSRVLLCVFKSQSFFLSP